jgi:hypothetical protein
LEQTLEDYQAGFRPSRLTIDQTHIVRQILENCYEFGIELHNILIDYKQGFDKVNRLKTYESLKPLDSPTKLIRLVEKNIEKLRSSGKCISGESRSI